MERIASFSVDHSILQPGLYRSRTDGGVVTYDLRFVRPNSGRLLTNAQLHSAEHLVATLLRNSRCRDAIIYFGPMGCRTGFYLVVFGEITSREILPLIRDLFDFVAGFEGEIPGAAPEACGNYLDQNLPAAQWWARRFLRETLKNIDDAHLAYGA